MKCWCIVLEQNKHRTSAAICSEECPFLVDERTNVPQAVPRRATATVFSIAKKKKKNQPSADFRRALVFCQNVCTDLRHRRRCRLSEASRHLQKSACEPAPRTDGSGSSLGLAESTKFGRAATCTYAIVRCCFLLLTQLSAFREFELKQR